MVLQILSDDTSRNSSIVHMSRFNLTGDLYPSFRHKMTPIRQLMVINPIHADCIVALGHCFPTIYMSMWAYLIRKIHRNTRIRTYATA